MAVASVRDLIAQSFLFEDPRPREDVKLLVCTTDGELVRLVIAASDAASLGRKLVALGGAS